MRWHCLPFSLSYVYFFIIIFSIFLPQKFFFHCSSSLVKISTFTSTISTSISSTSTFTAFSFPSLFPSVHYREHIVIVPSCLRPRQRSMGEGNHEGRGKAYLRETRGRGGGREEKGLVRGEKGLGKGERKLGTGERG